MATSFLSQKPFARVIKRKVKALLQGGGSGGMTPRGGKGEALCRAKGLSNPKPQEKQSFSLQVTFRDNREQAERASILEAASHPVRSPPPSFPPSLDPSFLPSAGHTSIVTEYQGSF